MKNIIYVTHEVIVNSSRIYPAKKFKTGLNDFESIDSVSCSSKGNYVKIIGNLHLYGVMIQDFGFYDVINDIFYPLESLENACVITRKSDFFFHSVKQVTRALNVRR